jgi:hypothetical protein
MTNSISGTTPANQSIYQQAQQAQQQQAKQKAQEPQDTVTLSQQAKQAADPDHDGH